jgi:hypothetical protein
MYVYISRVTSVKCLKLSKGSKPVGPTTQKLYYQLYLMAVELIYFCLWSPPFSYAH